MWPQCQSVQMKFLSCTKSTTLCPGLPGWAGTKRSIHPYTHPDHQTSFINFLHLLWTIASICSIYVLDSPFPQPLSRSSLVFLLVWNPLLHTPCISTIAACFAVIPMHRDNTMRLKCGQQLYRSKSQEKQGSHRPQIPSPVLPPGKLL